MRAGHAPWGSSVKAVHASPTALHAPALRFKHAKSSTGEPEAAAVYKTKKAMSQRAAAPTKEGRLASSCSGMSSKARRCTASRT